MDHERAQHSEPRGKRRSVLRRALVLIPLVAVIACAQSGHRPAASPLSHTAWRVSVIDGAVPGPATLVRFQDDEVSLATGCSVATGPFRIEGGRLIAGPFVEKDLTCAQDDRRSARNALDTLMVAAPRVVRQGDALVVRSPRHEAHLTRADG